MNSLSKNEWWIVCSGVGALEANTEYYLAAKILILKDKDGINYIGKNYYLKFGIVDID